MPLKNSVYVLPVGEETREDFEWLARESGLLAAPLAGRSPNGIDDDCAVHGSSPGPSGFERAGARWR